LARNYEVIVKINYIRYAVNYN